MDSRDDRDAYLAKLRAKVAQLDKNLQTLEHRAEHETADTRQYLRYARQFDRLRQRTRAMSESFGSEIDNDSTAAVDWAELETRLDREWRDLLEDFSGIENVFGRKSGDNK